MSEVVADGAGGSAAVAPTTNENEVAPDEDYSKSFAPVVQLAEVETKTGEEDEDVIFKVRAKLFRFSRELKEWKERGTGDVRVLKHKTNKKIRLLMRREKTLKICLNQFVNPNVELKENVGSDRSWVWQAVDYADGERDEALLAIRFRDSENAKQFMDAYDDAREHMRKLRASPPSNDATEDSNKESTADEKKGEETKSEEAAKSDQA